jgi:Do/DeqQ family serine protease
MTIKNSSITDQLHSTRSTWRKPASYLLVAMLGAGGAIAANLAITNPSTSSLQPQTLTQLPLPATRPIAASDPNFIANVVNQVGPAVVRIDATQTVQTRSPEMDPFFRRFFGDQMPTPDQPRQRSGVGSGFIFSNDGQILTNAHVVDGAETVTVTLKDGREFEGRVLGTDPVTDVAVLKIEAADLPTVTLSDSEQLQPGEWAIAIGNPLGLDNTVTAGIVSATGRSSSQVGEPDKRVSFIQTDAAINPGNSGGPLLNQQGQVIGMNTAIIQGAQGIGFAIPINTAKRIADQLVSTGKVDHAYLGLQMQTLTAEIKQQINSDPNSGLNVTEDTGVLIGRVMPNSPAARAGLRAGDVIKQVNGQPIEKAEDLQRLVEGVSVGDRLALALSRNGEPINLSVQAGSFPTAQSDS